MPRTSFGEMTSTRWPLRTLAAVVFAGLAIFLLLPKKTADNRVILDSRAAARAGFGREATLRNVTDGPIRYTVKREADPGPAILRTLEVGGVDRLEADVPVEISYPNGSRKGSHKLYPGQPYSFRYDERGLVRVYPGSHGREDEADLAPYVPTPIPVVERMLEIAGVEPGDVVYDLGCGDGRMVIAAAKTFGARGVGVELDENLIAVCEAEARREGVDKETRFIRMDATKAHLTAATVLALYLLPESLAVLSPLFERELRPGGRIVSHNYRIPGWEARLARSEVMTDEAGREHKIFLYRMPERSEAGVRAP
jgi:SAM-dependent methyltransferase